MSQYRQVVRWLENNKIRYYQPKERQGLDSVKDDVKWKAAYEEYLRQLVRFGVNFLKVGNSLFAVPPTLIDNF